MSHFPQKTNAAGSISGYIAGGVTGDAATIINAIDKFNFGTEANSVQLATIISPTRGPAGMMSASCGYYVAGADAGITTFYKNVDKFLFSNDVMSGNIASTVTGKYSCQGFSTSTNGYIIAGVSSYNSSTGAEGMTNAIEKLIFATEGNLTAIGTLTEGKSRGAAFQNYSHGFAYCGCLTTAPITFSVRIEKFFFAIDGSSQNIATVANNAFTGKGSSSPTAGYYFGFSTDGIAISSSSIFKMILATEGAASAISTLGTAALFAGTPYTLYNTYLCGGYIGSNTDTNAIQRFGHSSDGSSVSVATLASGAHDSQCFVNY